MNPHRQGTRERRGEPGPGESLERSPPLTTAPPRSADSRRIPPSDAVQVSPRAELYRKLIHLASVTVPIAAWTLSRRAGLELLGAIVLLALAIEWSRFRLKPARDGFERFTGSLLRPHEHRGLAGATFMAAAYFLALLIFPKSVAIAAMLYNGLGDAAAALVGRRWGRHRASWGKSWEGAGAALVVALGAGSLVPGLAWPAVLLGAVFAAAIEFLPLPGDDNLRVTLGGGIGAWLGMLLV